MRKTQLLIIVALLTLLLAINQWTDEGVFLKSYFGGLPWYGWAGISVFLLLVGIGFALSDAARARFLLEKNSPLPAPEEVDLTLEISPEDLERLDPNGPSYPHPVIFPERCIGCHACVDACPHDVLAMVNNIATPVAPDQCLEDTACQLECPVKPKACIVVNATRKIKPRPVPVRDERFMTNVPGCYLIGDVSGTPLIKNAANEGADVIKHIARELRDGTSPPEPKAELDVAVIGIGVAGLSAVLMAHECGLRFVGIEQDKVLATIDAYPKGKYVFLKPETMEWRGALEVPGLDERGEQLLDEALAELMGQPVNPEHAGPEAGASAAAESQASVDAHTPIGAQSSARITQLLEGIIASLFKKAEKLGPEQRDLLVVSLCEIMLAELPEEAAGVGHDKAAMAEASPVAVSADRQLELSIEQRKLVVVRLLGESLGGLRARLDEGERRRLRQRLRERVMSEMRKKIAGEQREEMLETWLDNLRRSGARINEGESCQSVRRASDGDYFIIETERGRQKERATYSARRVVLAIGNRGTPMRLGVDGEEMQVEREGRRQSKVLYKLSNPEEFKRQRIIVVGGGNSAVEAAVDLVARRDGERITFRPPDEVNEVTLVVRSDFKNDLKFGNKMQVYQCIDEGRLRVRFGEAVKAIRENQVVLMDARTEEEKLTLANDFIFALIGGDKPTRFLESIGITIPKS